MDYTAEHSSASSPVLPPLASRLAIVFILATQHLLACGPTQGSAGVARVPPDERAARAPWTEALRQAWKERRTDARWLRETLDLGLVAAAETERARVPAETRVAALERSGAGRYRVHLGRLLHPQDPGSLQVHRRLRIAWDSSASAPTSSWEPLRQPEAVPRMLAEELRAVAAAEAHLEGRRPGWRAEMKRLHQVSHLPFVRRQSQGKIELWLVPFSTVPTQVVLGGDYRLIVDPTGRRVESFTTLHTGMTRIVVPAPSREQKPEVRNHLHGSLEGDLPSATDLLKIATSPALRGLAVMGPRYALLVGLSTGGMDWEGLLYWSERFRALLDDSSR